MHLRERLLIRPARSRDSGQWYVAIQPMKVERDGSLIDLEPGAAIPEMWDAPPRRQKLEEARGRIIFRPAPQAPRELVAALVDALSATKTGKAKADAILEEYGLTTPDDLALPSIDPELRAAWDEAHGRTREERRLREIQARATVVPTDQTAFGLLQRTSRAALVELVAALPEDEIERYRQALGLPGPVGEWPQRGLAGALALSTGVGQVEYLPEHEQRSSSA